MNSFLELKCFCHNGCPRDHITLMCFSFFFWEKQKHVMLSENYTKSTWMWSDSWDTWTKKGCNGVTKPANKGDHRGLSAFLKAPPTRHHPPFKSISSPSICFLPIGSFPHYSLVPITFLINLIPFIFFFVIFHNPFSISEFHVNPNPWLCDNLIIFPFLIHVSLLK